MSVIDLAVRAVDAGLDFARGGADALARPADGRRSLVAGINAMFRAAESRRPAGDRILHDPWAQRFAERDPRVVAIRAVRFLAPVLEQMIEELQAAHCVRHRALDELVLRAVEDGYRQVVMVGAGYDMRPSRFAAELGGVRWVEVDHPATQTRKRRRLAGLRGVGAPVDAVALDLLTEDLEDGLRRTPFDATRPACFVAEGLVHYLTRPRVEALFRAMGGAAAPRRVLVSFIRSEMYRRAPELFVRLVQAVREVPKLHFTGHELTQLAAAHGLRLLRTWSAAEQVAELALEGRGRAISLSQDVAMLENER